jgi:predicted nucleic acid-binding protein
VGRLARAARLMPLYLVDSSIWIGARRRPNSYLPHLLAERIASDEVATCAPVALEVLVGPPDGAALTRDWEAVWQKLRWLPVDLTVSERALSLLRALAQTTAGAHRRRPIDYLVAATAQSGEEVVLWHWDRDLTVICDHAGIAHEPEHERAKRNGIDGEPDGGPRG